MNTNECEGIPVAIRDEWVGGSGVDAQITRLNAKPMTGEEARIKLNRTRYGKALADGWWCESVDPLTGELTGFGQFKPSEPHIGRGGKPAKYLTPSGMDSEAILLRHSQPNYWQNVIADIEAPIVLTEGAKKVGAGLTAGYPTIGCTGVWNFLVKKTDVVKSLKPFAQPGRTFILAFDGDYREKEQVLDALNATIKVLTKLGCTTLVATWDEYKGLDDLLVNKGVTFVEGVIDGAKSDKVVDINSGRKNKEVKSKNKQLLLDIEARWGKRLRFNEMHFTMELDGESLDDDLFARVTREFDVDTSDPQAFKLCYNIAKENRYSPVKEYLEGLREMEVDGAILDNLAERYMGSTEPLHNVYLKKTLLAAVARVYEPGYTHHTVCVLQGKQGVGKSQFWRQLANEADWFDDTIVTGSSDKDERMKLRRFWLVELAELDGMFKRKEVSSFRAFITSANDNLRIPYEKFPRAFSRTSIFVGSVNPEDFLQDIEGNRRYWVVPVVKDKIDIDLLISERESIWAAAVQYYLAHKGEKHLTYLTAGEQELSNSLNAGHEAEDVWQTYIDQYIVAKNLDELLITDVLTEACDVPVGQQNSGHYLRVAKCLKALNWEKNPKKKRINGTSVHSWFRKPELATPLATPLATLLATPSNPYISSVLEDRLPMLPIDDDKSLRTIDNPHKPQVDVCLMGLSIEKSENTLATGNIGNGESEKPSQQGLEDVANKTEKPLVYTDLALLSKKPETGTTSIKLGELVQVGPVIGIVKQFFGESAALGLKKGVIAEYYSLDAMKPYLRKGDYVLHNNTPLCVSSFRETVDGIVVSSTDSTLIPLSDVHPFSCPLPL